MNEAIEELLTRGVQEILPSKKGLADLMAKRKISLYQGFDPSSAHLHLGNLIGVRKLAQFQKLGHKVIFLVGDFTGTIGDPTDKSAARKKLTKEEVLENARGWKKQIENVLKFDGANAAEIKYNSEWLAKLSFEEILELAGNFTVQQMIERDFFQERIKKDLPIRLPEFLYPVMQGYDSIVMGVDLEIGGNDQLFNMLAGRTLMKALKGKEKFVLTMKLLADPTGKKMGKTEGNTINLTDKPDDMFGKIMSLPDSLIEPGIELLTDLQPEVIANKSPLDSKKALAFEIVKQIHGRTGAENTKKEFERVFQKKDLPSDIPVVLVKEESLPLLDLVFATKAVASRSEAKRLILQGGIDVEEKTINDPTQEIAIPKEGIVIKVGKIKFVKVKSK